MKLPLAVAVMFLSIGCIDIPAMNGLMDKLLPEEERTYSTFEVWNTQGNFAPDPNQDQETVTNAIADIVSDPLQFQKPLQNLSSSGNNRSIRPFIAGTSMHPIDKNITATAKGNFTKFGFKRSK